MGFICWMNLAGRRLEAGLGILLELQFVESYWVCYCIPNFPCKCGWHLKESYKSVIQKASSAVAESVKTLGIVSRNGASPVIPEASSQGLGSEPLSLVTYRLSIFRQASNGPSFHICVTWITVVPFDMLGRFTNSLSNCLLNTSGTILDSGDRAVNKMDKNPCLIAFIF